MVLQNESPNTQVSASRMASQHQHGLVANVNRSTLPSTLATKNGALVVRFRHIGMFSRTRRYKHKESAGRMASSLKSVLAQRATTNVYHCQCFGYKEVKKRS